MLFNFFLSHAKLYVAFNVENSFSFSESILFGESKHETSLQSYFSITVSEANDRQ